MENGELNEWKIIKRSPHIGGGGLSGSEVLPISSDGISVNKISTQNFLTLKSQVVELKFLHNDGTYTVMKSSAYQDQPEIFIYHYDSDGKNPKGIFMSSRKNWLPYIYNDNGSTAMSGPIPALVSYNYETSSWYRIWSDGWIEQGGITGKVADYGTATVTFPVSFTNTNYTLSYANWRDGSGEDNSWNGASVLNLYTRTKETFQIYNRGNANGGRIFTWYACGK